MSNSSFDQAFIHSLVTGFCHRFCRISNKDRFVAIFCCVNSCGSDTIVVGEPATNDLLNLVLFQNVIKLSLFRVRSKATIRVHLPILALVHYNFSFSLFTICVPLCPVRVLNAMIGPHNLVHARVSQLYHAKKGASFVVALERTMVFWVPISRANHQLKQISILLS